LTSKRLGCLISQAEQRGQQRLAEMNRTVEKNLIAIIGGLTGSGCGGTCPSSCACTSTPPAGPQEENHAS